MSGLREKRFIVMLTPKDRYRHSHIRLKGEVLSFVAQYETLLEGKWLPVVRYDTEHGYAHRDIMDEGGSKHKTPMFTEDYNEALTFAEYDIKLNWKIYRGSFLGGIDRGDKER